MGKKISGLSDLIGSSDEQSIKEEIQKESKNSAEMTVPKSFKMKPSLHKRIKIEAAEREIDISVLVEEMVMKYFEDKK